MINLIEKAYLTPPDNEAKAILKCFSAMKIFMRVMIIMF